METLTQILLSFKNLFHSGVIQILPYAKGTLFTLAVIDMAKGHLFRLDEEDHLKLLINNIFKYGVIIWILVNYADYTDKILNSFIIVGLKIGGSSISISEFTNPSAIITLGIQISAPIWETLKESSIFKEGFATQLSLAVLALATVACYFVIAIQIFVTYLEFYVIGAIGLIFVPFGVLNKTAFMLEKAIGAVVSTGVKLMTLAAIMSAIIPLIKQWMPAAPIPGAATTTDIQSCLTALGGSAALAFLCWHIPSVAAGYMNGSPSLSAASTASAAGATAGTAGGAIGAMSSAVGTASGLATAAKVGATAAAAGGAGTLGQIGGAMKGMSSYASQKSTAGEGAMDAKRMLSRSGEYGSGSNVSNLAKGIVPGGSKDSSSSGNTTGANSEQSNGPSGDTNTSGGNWDLPMTEAQDKTLNNMSGGNYDKNMNRGEASTMIESLGGEKSWYKENNASQVAQGLSSRMTKPSGPENKNG